MKSIIIICLVFLYVRADVRPTESFPHRESLDKDENFILYWKTNTTHITFEAHVKTRGYVGFGISPNGKMYPSDVVVGWIEADGTPHFQDCHTVGHVAPVADQSQDWKLLHGEENNFGTSLKFVRPLKSCDSDDLEITDDTVHLIYAYHPDDPTSFTSLPWHGASRRGSKSLLLLSGTDNSHKVMPSDVKTFVFSNRNFHVPAKDTTYHCTTFKLPDLGKKHHMIKHEPIITKGNELHVHHFILYHCQSHIDPNLAGRDFDCYHQRPKEFSSCYLVSIAWAIGGEAFYFPSEAGYSLGTPSDPSFFMLETHYDNPTIRSAVIYFLFQGMHSHPEGIKVFGVLQHSHLLGRAIKTRVGGLTTRDEMCLSFLWYYPKIGLDTCISSPMYNQIDQDPNKAVQILDTWDWRNQTIRDNFNNIMKTTDYFVIKAGASMSRTYEKISYLTPTTPYVPSPSPCFDSNNHLVSKQKQPNSTIHSSVTTHNHVHQHASMTHHQPINHHVSSTTQNPVKHLNTGSLTPTELYTHMMVLDTNNDFKLYWKTNKTHITFETIVKTRGYVGFGISTNGKMFPADVIVGWVADDGTPHLNDYHTTGHVPPVLDRSQDWDDTTHVIYSYHPDDPQSPTSLPWHGAMRRGQKSMLLLSGPKQTNIRMPSDVKTYELLNGNYEPVITPGNELNVHHILIYHCLDNVDANMAGRSYQCYGAQRPRELNSCYAVYLAWAIGGEAFYFPQNVGMSIGTSSDPTFFVMETHYDNPTMRTDMVDNSGIRVYYTPTLRQYDAGVIETGMHLIIIDHVFKILLPNRPSMSKLIHVLDIRDGLTLIKCVKYLHVHVQCFIQGMQNQPQGVKVFGVLQHAHLLGRKIRTRLVRNGVEQEPIASDNHYDFDYQDFRLLKEERTILPGDSIIVECTHDSTGRTTPTHGGLTTQDEMCLTFVLYYPRMDVDICNSSPRYDDVVQDPSQAVHTLQRWNWKDPAVRQKFQNVLANSTHTVFCSGKHLTPKVRTVYKTLSRTLEINVFVN
ncbi:hypothetical protein KUTeg_022163, partial [Tegillarca granosa]